MIFRAVFAIFFAAVCRVCAQEALSDALPSPAEFIAQPFPDSAWLDLRQNAPRNSKPQNAPAWVEALTLLPAQATEGGGNSKSIFPPIQFGLTDKLSKAPHFNFQLKRNR